MGSNEGLEELARGQAGLVSRRQVLVLGHTDEWIEARLARGAWQRLTDGVYATFTGAVPFEARAWAAVLRAGPGATLGGRTAATLFGLVPVDLRQPIELIIPAHRRVAAWPGVVVRTSRHLDRRRCPGLTPPRVWIEDAVLDLAEQCASLDDVAGWVSRANRSRLTTPGRIRMALGERARHPWRTELSAMLADVADGAESPLELRYLNRVERAHRLPRGSRQAAARSRGRRQFIDVDLPEFSTRIELDGQMGHLHDGAFRDRRRDNDGVRSGQATLRYGYVEVFAQACAVAAEVAAVLQARGWSGQPRRCGPTCQIGQREGSSAL